MKFICPSENVLEIDTEVVDWWSLLGATLPELRRRDFLDTDNVHLSFSENGKAAAALYAKDTEAGCESEDGETEKDGERRPTRIME
jgi:hypothetical protein